MCNNIENTPYPTKKLKNSMTLRSYKRFGDTRPISLSIIITPMVHDSNHQAKLVHGTPNRIHHQGYDRNPINTASGSKIRSITTSNNPPHNHNAYHFTRDDSHDRAPITNGGHVNNSIHGTMPAIFGPSCSLYAKQP